MKALLRVTEVSNAVKFYRCSGRITHLFAFQQKASQKRYKASRLFCDFTKHWLARQERVTAGKHPTCVFVASGSRKLSFQDCADCPVWQGWSCNHSGLLVVWLAPGFCKEYFVWSRKKRFEDRKIKNQKIKRINKRSCKSICFLNFSWKITAVTHTAIH